MALSRVGGGTAALHPRRRATAEEKIDRTRACGALDYAGLPNAGLPSSTTAPFAQTALRRVTTAYFRLDPGPGGQIEIRSSASDPS